MQRIENKELYPLKVFLNEFKTAKAYLVCNEKTERIHEQIRIIPYREFLQNLWAGMIIK